MAEVFFDKFNDRLKKAHVAVAGLGGLGSNIAVALARSNVGNLHLIDFDRVDMSNLNRQHYNINHLGKYKTEALKEQLKFINPDVNVTIDTVKVTPDNIKTLFQNDEIICEAFDKAEMKAMLVNEVLEVFPEKFLVSGSGMAGYETSNTIVTKRITEKFYLCGDGVSGLAYDRKLLAPRVSICAGHQANMILRIILGEYDV